MFHLCSEFSGRCSSCTACLPDSPPPRFLQVVTVEDVNQLFEELYAKRRKTNAGYQWRGGRAAAIVPRCFGASQKWMFCAKWHFCHFVAATYTWTFMVKGTFIPSALKRCLEISDTTVWIWLEHSDALNFLLKLSDDCALIQYNDLNK